MKSGDIKFDSNNSKSIIYINDKINILPINILSNAQSINANNTIDQILDKYYQHILHDTKTFCQSFFFVQAILFFANASMSSYWVLFAGTLDGSTSLYIGILSVVTFWTVAMFDINIVRLADKHGFANCMLFSVCFATFGYLLICFSKNILLFSFGHTCSQIGLNLTMSLFFGTLTKLLPTHEFIKYVEFIKISQAISPLIAMIIGSLFVHFLGYRECYIFVTCVSFTSVLYAVHTFNYKLKPLEKKQLQNKNRSESELKKRNSTSSEVEAWILTNNKENNLEYELTHIPHEILLIPRLSQQFPAAHMLKNMHSMLNKHRSNVESTIENSSASANISPFRISIEMALIFIKIGISESYIVCMLTWFIPYMIARFHISLIYSTSILVVGSLFAGMTAYFLIPQLLSKLKQSRIPQTYITVVCHVVKIIIFSFWGLYFSRIEYENKAVSEIESESNYSKYILICSWPAIIIISSAFIIESILSSFMILHHVPANEAGRVSGIRMFFQAICVGIALLVLGILWDIKTTDVKYYEWFIIQLITIDILGIMLMIVLIISNHPKTSRLSHILPGIEIGDDHRNAEKIHVAALMPALHTFQTSHMMISHQNSDRENENVKGEKILSSIIESEYEAND